MWELQLDLGVCCSFEITFRHSHWCVKLTLNYPQLLGDVAISSAKFILVSSNLYTLLTLTDLSCKVFTRIKFNFVCYLELCCILSHSLFSLGSSFGQLCTTLLLYQLLQESFSLLGMYVSALCGHHWQWLCRM